MINVSYSTISAKHSIVVHYSTTNYVASSDQSFSFSGNNVAPYTSSALLWSGKYDAAFIIYQDGLINPRHTCSNALRDQQRPALF